MSVLRTSVTRTSLARAAVVFALAALAGTAAMTPARAQSYTIDFEDARVPSNAGPNTTDAAPTFSVAYGGTDTVQGVTFSDNFTVFRKTYSNEVGGFDLYGAPDGDLALTNIVNPPGLGATAPDTGPADPGPDGLTLTTGDVLTSAYFGTVDYGDGSYGADQVTVTALGAGGDLDAVTLDLDMSGTLTLTKMDTSAFLAYAGQITGYRIDRTPGQYGVLGDYGGNYVADDFTFTAAAAPAVAPEPSSVAAFACAGLGVAALILKARKRRSVA